METYKNLAGTVLEVHQKGKGFKTVRHYKATNHSPAESVEKHHRTYSAVEKIIKAQSFERLD
jgi:hypothetical protein